jgi:uncharacterized protein YidB (DUF937 family)
MGLFDGISSMVSSALGSGDSSALTNQLLGVLEQHGISGMSGLAAQFEQSGLGAQMASWVGTGTNLPIDAASIQAALGSPVVASIAAKLGIDPAMASQLLAQHLPNIVDAATPGGKVPT